MAITVARTNGVKYSEDPAQAVNGELILVTMSLTITAAGFTTAAAGDLPLSEGAKTNAPAIPPGNWRIRTDLSHLTCPIGTATSDLDLGLAAYTKADGSSQAAQPALLADSLDVGGGAIDQNLNAVSPKDVNSRSGADIVASFDTANSPAAGRIVLDLVIQKLPLP